MKKQSNRSVLHFLNLHLLVTMKFAYKLRMETAGFHGLANLFWMMNKN
nr:hypothetical protein [uncultured Methanobacterium sp.]